MSERAISILTILAAASSGVMGGIFFIFSNTIMTALDRVSPASGIATMQSINTVIQNPLFFLFFFGPALLSVILVACAFLGWMPGGHAWVYFGAACYLVGIMAVTIAINVPMNNALDAVDPASAEGASLWADYLIGWTRWNHLRTVAGIAACASYSLALR